MAESTLFSRIKSRVDRMIEALCCFYFMAIFLFLNFGMLFFFIFLLFTPFFYIPLLYAAWIYIDRDTPNQGGRRIQWLRAARIWNRMAQYFPVKLHKTVDLDPSKNYIFPFHPHGIFCVGGFLSFGVNGTNFDETFPGITSHLLVLDGHFKFPVYRDYVLAGGLGAVNSKSIQYKLTRLGPGHSVWIAVGGSSEAFLSTPNAYRLKIKSRRGFIKMAMKTGAPLVPVFSFGETDIFKNLTPAPNTIMFKIQEFLRRLLGFAPVMFRGNFMIMPFRKPINTVVGAPIQLPKTEVPTNEEVDKWHSIYLNELRKLYDDHKSSFGDGNKVLEFC